MRDFDGRCWQRWLQDRRKTLPGWLGKLLVSLARASTERYNSRLRRELLRQDDNLNDMLAFSGRGE